MCTIIKIFEKKGTLLGAHSILYLIFILGLILHLSIPMLDRAKIPGRKL